MKTLIITLLLTLGFAGQAAIASGKKRTRIDFNSRIENARSEQIQHKRKLKSFLTAEEKQNPKAKTVIEFYEGEIQWSSSAEARR